MNRIVAVIVPIIGLAMLCIAGGAEAGARDSERDAPAIPETPAGRQLAAWLRAFNTADPDTLRRSITEQYAPTLLSEASAADRAGFLGQFALNEGPLTLRRVEKSTDHEVAVLAEAEPTEAWVRISLQVEAAPPHRITSERFERARRPNEGRPARKLSDAAILRNLEAYLKRLVAGDRFSGTVLVAKDGKELFKKAYGLASHAYRVPNRIDTKFNLGSMNKMFTGVAVAQLVEQGKLSYSDPVIQHLPDYPNRSAAEKVTVHHLLTHTSGMGSYFNSQFMEASRDRYRSVQDYFPLFASEPLAFEPGQRWQYSNSGFMLLGALIEKVSGQSYFNYVREHIYKPAGMTNTDAYEMDRDVPNLAVGYTRMGAPAGERRNNLYLHVIKGGPAGGGFSTVEDLFRFDRALRGHKLLSSGATDTLLTGKVETGLQGNEKYAYGFSDQRINGTRVVGHGGGFPGINSQLDMYLDLGYTVAVMSNYDPPAAARIAYRLRDMITQR
jgi:CubicO group peptidase (beta-lactamase class C family)